MESSLAKTVCRTVQYCLRPSVTGVLAKACRFVYGNIYVHMVISDYFLSCCAQVRCEDIYHCGGRESNRD